MIDKNKFGLVNAMKLSLIAMLLLSCNYTIAQDAKKIKATSVQAEAIFVNPSEESITEKGFT
jgi:hypothetical protein